MANDGAVSIFLPGNLQRAPFHPGLPECSGNRFSAMIDPDIKTGVVKSLQYYAFW